MGLSGDIQIRITTKFDAVENKVSRTVYCLGGWGLHYLTSSQLGDAESWNINRSIIADTIQLPDGEYTIDKKHVGPGRYDYRWTPVENSRDN